MPDSDLESVSAPTSLQKKRKAAVSKSGEKSASKRKTGVDATEEPESPSKTRKIRKSDSNEEGKALKKSRKRTSEESSSDLLGEVKSPSKKSSSSTRSSSSGSEDIQKGARVKTDDINVSSSEPPDLSVASKKRKIRAPHAKGDAARGDLEDQSASVEKAKVSSGVARLKEIQQKKPR